MASKAYEIGTPDLVAVFNEAMARFHPDLKEVDLKVALFKVHGFDENDQPEHGLKLHGHPADGVAKNYDLKRRVQTGKDCEISIDALAWDQMSDESRLALVDHELTHFSLQYDKDGRLKLDDIGRPRVGMRLDDAICSFFWEVAARHGPASGESRSVKSLYAKLQECLAAFEAAYTAVQESKKKPELVETKP